MVVQEGSVFCLFCFGGLSVSFLKELWALSWHNVSELKTDSTLAVSTWVPAVLERLAVLHVISSAGVFNAPSTASSHINFCSSHIPPLGLVLFCLALSVHNGFFSTLAGPQALKQRIGPYVPMYFSLCFNLIISPFHGSVLGRFSFHIFPMQAAHCINASAGTLSQEDKLPMGIAFKLLH